MPTEEELLRAEYNVLRNTMRHFGMGTILGSLLDLVTEVAVEDPASYLLQLKADLQTALDNYANRYEGEE